MHILAVLLVLVPYHVDALTVKDLEQKLEQKDLQHQKELAKINAIISALQVKSDKVCDSQKRK